jgi:endonuclease YncB( thermonuclease family)
MIREGWARAYRQYRHPWRDLFILYEKEARSKGLGMWKDTDGKGRREAKGRRKKAP